MNCVPEHVSATKICPQCNAEYEAEQRFCPRDGSTLRSKSQGGDLVGSVIADRYHVISRLGEGGMGQVYLAEHVRMGRRSAVKVMHPGMVHDPEAIGRFNREAANAARISHPNVAAIYDFGETADGLIYLAMEFVEGEPLAALIARGATAPARAGSIVRQTGDALAVAHELGIVHRDLKPDNIMIARGRDGSDCVKVVDFGIAKAATGDVQKVTRTGLIVGTPEYMSPEQLAGDQLDGRSDIYALGLVAFNALTGRLPFPSETAQEAMILRLTDRPRSLAEIRPDVSWPAALQRVLDRALARDARERYSSASAFGRDFEQAVTQLEDVAAADAHTAAFERAPLPATRVAPAPTLIPDADAATPTRSRRGIAMLAAGAGGVAVLVGTMVALGVFQDGEVAPTIGTDSATAAASAIAEAPSPAAERAAANPARGSVVRSSGDSGPARSSTRAPVPSGAATRRSIDEIKRLSESSDPADLSAAVTSANRLLPQLESSAEIAEALYYQAMAKAAQDDRAGACDGFRRAASNASGRLLTAVNVALEACQ